MRMDLRTKMTFNDPGQFDQERTLTFSYTTYSGATFSTLVFLVAPVDVIT